MLMCGTYQGKLLLLVCHKEYAIDTHNFSFLAEVACWASWLGLAVAWLCHVHLFGLCGVHYTGGTVFLLEARTTILYLYCFIYVNYMDTFKCIFFVQVSISKPG